MNGILTSDNVNINLDVFCNALKVTMDMVAPVKSVQISGKRFIEPWMTSGLEESSRKKQRLYKITLKANAHLDDVTKCKSKRNIYNRLKRKMIHKYYMEQTEKFKTNTKELWKIINRTVSRHKNSGSIISYITVDGLKITSPQEIAEITLVNFMPISVQI